MAIPSLTTAKSIAHDVSLLPELHKWVLVGFMVFGITACTTPTPSNAPSGVTNIYEYPASAVTQRESIDTDDTTLNRDAVLWSQKIAAEKGWLFALAELESLEAGLLSPNTERFIRSQLFWLEGDTVAADSELGKIFVSSDDGLDLLLAERQRRALETGNAIAAAKVALERLQLGYQSQDSATYSDVFNFLSTASEQKIAAELRKAEPRSDWAAWLSLNRAYRQGRQEVMEWRQQHPRLPNGLLDLPSGLPTWLNNDLPVRVAVLLPLSGRLKDAGERVLRGVTEGFFDSYRDAALRPQLITVDTELASNGRAAYLTALERGADFVIGPLTKERVAELQALDSLPIPVLALNRGATGVSTSFSAEKPLLSLSLAPEDEAIQLAALIWQAGLRQPMVIAPDSAWGQRMHSAFNTQWSALGGDITAITTLTSELSDNETIANSLATLQSESRIKEIEKAFEAPVDSQARRRTDLDSVVLLSPTPQMAREIRPLLRFHYAGKLPVYAPSTIYQSGSGIANRDLNGIQFVLPPSALATDSPRSQPLHALGLDAAALIDHFDQARETGGTLLFGETGDLSVDMMGNVHRRLKPAVIARGKARPVL